MQHFAFFGFEHSAFRAGSDQHFEFFDRVYQFMAGGRLDPDQAQQAVPGAVQSPDDGLEDPLGEHGWLGHDQGGFLRVL